MPLLHNWRIGRKHYSSFSGAKIIDSDFTYKVQECKLFERNIMNVQKIYINFATDTRGKFILNIR